MCYAKLSQMFTVSGKLETGRGLTEGTMFQRNKFKSSINRSKHFKKSPFSANRRREQNYNLVRETILSDTPYTELEFVISPQKEQN